MADMNAPGLTFFMVLLAIWQCCLTASAVIIAGTDGAGNTNAPADDPGFNRIGVFQNDRSSVYVGNSWFLTANHNGAPTMVLMDGTNYTYMSGTWTQLTNNVGDTIDLAMFKVAGNTPSEMMSIRSVTPLPLQDIIMIGNGRDRTSGLTKWDSEWNVVTVGSYSYSGYTYDSSFPYATSLRWGDNAVQSIGLVSEGMTFFSTDFDNAVGEAQGAPGDSGGGAFIKNGLTWELAGTILYIGEYTNQPSAKVAAFGNLTYMADLSVYRSQIMGQRAVTDVDDDGIPDGWEYEKSGSAVNVSAVSDQDGDGFTGEEEYIADTDPTDSNSFWQVEGAITSANQTFTFEGSAARQYQLLYTTNGLATPDLIWITNGAPIWGEGPGTEIVLTNTEKMVFYRMQAILP
ncbi:trypsin-like serine protease [Tichowtungia aerotolerans]|uniref:Peptidase S1 domain-containing protein n=1 Tax=Tichowtungia aerotolerans TaxID=2697043 RepID=A0A6P1MB80_9BACT|nr:hypothetical protein [Tichowtungia aerotolerans]QHI68816.1 hypothetical protein GT409_04915 [Tichowtungia aerotolerans]